jgi:hypothetical protein
MRDVCTDAGCDEMLCVVEESIEGYVTYVDRLYDKRICDSGVRFRRVYVGRVVDPKQSLICL